MSAVLPEAELGHYQSVVITAAEKAAQGAKGHAKSFNTGFVRGPAGEWLLAKGGAADKALAARLTAAYSVSDAAFKALDEKALRAVCTGDFLHGLIDGTVRTLDQDLAAAKGAILSVAAWKTVVDAFYRHKDRVFVMTTQTWTGVVTGEKGAPVRVTSTTTGLDTWVVAGEGLRLSRSLDLQEKDAPAQ
jgi:hypothetical protein